ncbi:hypothetical protein B0I26_1191 [Anoxybacillus vitaminiphilus]|uniref:ABC-2 type transport system permease protein n=1 Tax=Paranoxybacillus vitaminiphilus TaxID=581036 RepID=A0A327Y5I6_9BACL|nr:hypothetical protein B0I26_1191 [Anoxybacillus vitaminiphilus]
MNKYILGLYAFLCIISLSSSIKKYYKEYFLSVEREILLIAPVKSSHIILSRFFVVALEVLFINVLFLIPIVTATYFAGIIDISMVLITFPQVISTSIFFSTVAHILFAIAYMISKGKSLKTVAYSVMTAVSVGVIAIIVFQSNYKSFFVGQNELYGSLFYVLFKYPQYLLANELSMMDAGIFMIMVIINAFLFFLSRIF